MNKSCFRLGDWLLRDSSRVQILLTPMGWKVTGNSLLSQLCR